MRVKSGVAAVTAAMVAVGAVGFVASQAPGDPVAIPAPVASFAPQQMSADETLASEPGDAGSTPAKRKLPATGAVASDTPSPAAPPCRGTRAH